MSYLRPDFPANAQAICMQAQVFERAYRAFAAMGKPVFEGH